MRLVIVARIRSKALLSRFLLNGDFGQMIPMPGYSLRDQKAWVRRMTPFGIGAAPTTTSSKGPMKESCSGRRRVASSKKGLGGTCTDVAVVHIHSGGTLPAATLGDSESLHLGDWLTFAIGNPVRVRADRQLGHHQRTGTRAGVNRAVGCSCRPTNSPTHPGNSGGPLIDLQRPPWVGINTAIASTQWQLPTALASQFRSTGRSGSPTSSSRRSVQLRLGVGLGRDDLRRG